jgi:8-oxo-dGTP diphosphatase
MVPLDRAVAVIIRDQRVLVVRRYRSGMSYAVLPGGGIESGETAQAAVERETREETGLIGRVADLLWVRDDGGRRATYFRIEAIQGTPLLGGPERERSSPDNQYGLRWLGVDDLPSTDLRPPEIAPLVMGLLASTQN